MSYLFAVISGLIQGFTEFLPISSSGHLSLFNAVAGGCESSFTFDVMLHLATLAAVFIVYRNDIALLVCSCFSLLSKLIRGKLKHSGISQDERYAVSVLLATLPMAGAVFVGDRIDGVFSEVRIIGIMLCINAAVLFLSDFIKKRSTCTPGMLSPLRAVGIGCFQLCAVLPGLSRSGMTVTGGLCMGLDRESAVRMSFIMSIPVIICANIGEIPDILTTPVFSGDIMPIALGMACAFVSGILSMKLLSFIAREKSHFRIFSFYCAAVGILAVISG